MSDDAPLPPKIEILPALWRDLKPHAERQSLFIVNGELDLATVAEKIAADDVVAIRAWIEHAKLVRPTLQQMQAWNTQEGARTFRCAIVQPYVLIQDYDN